MAIACQTSSGVASTSNSWVSSNGCAISILRLGFGGASGASGFKVGCTATTTRWSRPRGAFSSWYLLTKEVTAAANSSANAARSEALANRISPSIAKVARRLRAFDAGHELADVADELGGNGDQPPGREAIGGRDGSGSTPFIATGEIT